MIRVKETSRTFIKADENFKREDLARLAAKGKLERIEHGIYRNPNAEISEYESLIVASLIVPKGVICLLSALRFHDLTTQNPFEIWVAVKPHAHRPQTRQISLRIVHFSGKSLTEGIEEHEIGGEMIRVYNSAKTIADCFKFRHKTGLDTALEALKEARRKKLFTIDDLWYYAGICRVKNVIRPYLEAL